MIIWAITLKTDHQHNTHCVDKKEKVDAYVKKCMWKMRKRPDVHYEIKWLAVDFAVVYEINKRCPGLRKTYGEIHRYRVY